MDLLVPTRQNPIPSKLVTVRVIPDHPRWEPKKKNKIIFNVDP